ncbi:MAG: hypothetical protein R2838_20570 [Caldilineaceae bacterium]
MNGWARNWQGQPSEIRLYTVNAPAASQAEVDLAAPLVVSGRGWSVAPVDGQVRYAVRPKRRCCWISRRRPTRWRLRCLVRLPADVTINGVPVETFSAADDGWMTVPVPAAVADEPVDRVRSPFVKRRGPSRRWHKPPAAEDGPCQPPGQAWARPSSLLVQSAGEEVGNFAAIFLNGTDVSLNQRIQSCRRRAGRHPAERCI